ncbi:MAG: M48 family metallopeptidase [Gammaproteobacteria bacterium]|nr:M48 family metallopeptidase [Gammaproteobacteria bacterium]MDH4313732.1 M48 family metallopeptidase [Gammaproteobacteria bacterium]MDH5212976.1 M48 family metallopeptidase [Gammaproteobacteria bacterium]MDH5500406.1 M48 family metallopeptidase [Gammaproteobacteria bacterium]
MQTTARQIPLFPPEDAIAAKPGSGEPGFAIRESARARRLSIKVFPRGRVEVVVPKRTKPVEVANFVAENRDWIRKARDSFASNHMPESFALPVRIDMPALGRSMLVQYSRDASLKSVRYRVNGGLLTLRGNTTDHGQCLAAIKRWLASVAKEEFAPALAEHSRLTGIGFKKMHVRAQRTCWGSRSSSGTISLNLCLLFLKPSLVRYLMIHELCHGQHMNHSRRFWKLVGNFEPNYRRLDRELTECWQVVPAWLGLY